MSNTDIYQTITNKVLKHLESNDKIESWVKPWACLSSSGGVQLSIAKRKYSGVNQLILSMEKDSMGYDSSTWATYRGFQSVKGQVNKGERATDIIFYKKIEKEQITESGEKIKKAVFLARSYAVFNACQVSFDDGKKPFQDIKTESKAFDDIDSGELVRAIIKTHQVNLTQGGDRAYYRPSTDQIAMPERQTFNNASRYYETLLHELTHWTGHAKRLNREGIANPSGFGSTSYAFEELVAELGSAFTSQTLGVSSQEAIREDHLPYIKQWLDIMREDKRAIIKASALAQSSSDYLLKPIQTGCSDDLQQV